MITRIAIIIAIVIILVLTVIASRWIKRSRIVVVMPSYECADVIGDGACPWTSTAARFAKPTLGQHIIEPRGM